MKKYIITDLAKGNANITADQVLEIGGEGGGGTTGDYIPLSGTEVGKPVTGDIELDANGYLKIKKAAGLDGNKAMAISFNDDSSLYLSVDNDDKHGEFYINENGIGGSFDDESGITNFAYTNTDGFRANQYFGANYDDSTYVQKKYVDDLMDARIPKPPASGNYTLQSVDGVLSWV